MSWLNKLLTTERESKPPIYCLKKVVICVTTKRNGKLLQMLQHVFFLYCFSLKELRINVRQILPCILFFPISLPIVTAPYYVFINSLLCFY